jgi:uncharacterized membrane protein YecN with MAPEG domain
MSCSYAEKQSWKSKKYRLNHPVQGKEDFNMITSLYAGILAIFYVLLAFYVIRGRYRHQVSLGSGSHPEMERRIRIHGNFAEYAPFALLLLFLVEYGRFSPVGLHVLGVMLVTGRLFHVLGLQEKRTVPFARQIGMVLTLVMILVCAAILIWRYFVIATAPELS